MNTIPFRPLAAAVSALFLSLVPAVAPAQQTLEDLVRIEVLDGGLTAKGTHRAAIRVSLADGWKTYWRSPGDAGIPPRFDWSGSQNVKNVALNWPTPEVFELSGLQSVGYKHELVLPIEITTDKTGQPVRLRGNVELGICKDVCVPARLTFDTRLDPKAGKNPEIASALAAAPYSASRAGVRSAVCRLSPTADGGMRITTEITMPPAGGEEVTIIEPGNPQLWASETVSDRRGDVLTATAEIIHESGGGFALDRSRVRITVLGERYGVDIMGCTAG